MALDSEPLMVGDEDRVIDWLKASSSARIKRVVDAGTEIIEGRAEDGVFD